MNMKRFALLCGLVAAFLCLTQSAKAQYVQQIHRDGAGFVDERGTALTDREIIDLVGEDIYFDTVVGARKQYTAGRKLIIGGLIGLGAGYISTSLGAYTLVANSEKSVRYYEGDDNYPGRHYESDADPLQVAVGGIMTIGGVLAMAAGAVALDAGIPLKIIGQSRLNWVENDYNDRARDFSLEFGAAPNGIGLTLRF